ncbi:MAG: hypothetical protein HYV63_23875 [Candidatus Schekmanbacteria bacterium]|nr:hypothetical protein [Candidatus Schekmanbacteria bacterium]
MLGGIWRGLGFGLPQPEILPPEVRTPAELAEIVGGTALFKQEFQGVLTAGQDFFDEIGHLVNDIQVLLRAPGSPLVRPTDSAPMPTFSMPLPADLEAADRPFRPQPVKVQPWQISGDPEADLALGDSSAGGGPVSGRTVLLSLLQRLREAVGDLDSTLTSLTPDTASGVDLAGSAGQVEGSLGRLVSLLQEHGFPLRAILDVQQGFDAGTLSRDSMVALIKDGQTRGLEKDKIAAIQREAGAVLKATKSEGGSVVLSSAALSAEKVGTVKKRLGAMTDLLFDIARLQMRIALATAGELKV